MSVLELQKIPVNEYGEVAVAFSGASCVVGSCFTVQPVIV